MYLTTVLFDLDGTLLPMDQEAFTTGYFKLLAKKLAPHGYEPKSLVDAIWAGTAAMVKNDGSCTNEQAFWKKFSAIYGSEKALADQPLFEDFYANEFSAAQEICGFTPPQPRRCTASKPAAFASRSRRTPSSPALRPSIAFAGRSRAGGFCALYDLREFDLLQAESGLLPRSRAHAGRAAGRVPDGRQRRDGGSRRTRGGHGRLSADGLPHQHKKSRHFRLPPR